MQKRFSNKANRIHVEIQEIIQMFQILNFIDFATFFHNCHFKVSDTIMDINMRFKIMLQAIDIEIQFDIEKYNFFI